MITLPILLYMSAAAFLTAILHSVGGFAGALMMAIAIAPAIGVNPREVTAFEKLPGVMTEEGRILVGDERVRGDEAQEVRIVAGTDQSICGEHRIIRVIRAGKKLFRIVGDPGMSILMMQCPNEQAKGIYVPGKLVGLLLLRDRISPLCSGDASFEESSQLLPEASL